MDRRDHWEHVYHTKRPDQVSWFQAEARLSQALIARVAPDRLTRIIDIGAGASTLVDGLVTSGYRNVAVLDISAAALRIAKDRLAAAAASVTWIASDVLSANFVPGQLDVWHDRAVFHFLTDAGDRARYIAQVRSAVRAGGFVLVATFADDGPTRCSGLDVARYAPSELHREFGDAFALIESHRELHTTPTGAQQAFTYCLCRVRAESDRAMRVPTVSE
ncbi:MAG: class I SAM-dependent methyltransferase [Gemmatimonadaceae bacterium]|nr:class I SAM-dependent methyltransferase [Gemmatimonadaceae bacterium]